MTDLEENVDDHSLELLLVKETEVLKQRESIECILHCLTVCEKRLCETDNSIRLDSDALKNISVIFGLNRSKIDEELVQRKLKFNSSVTELVDALSQTANSLDKVRERVSQQKSELFKKVESLDSYIKKIEVNVKSSENNLEKLDYMSTNLAYLKAIQSTVDLSAKISSCMESNDIEKAIDFYLLLSDILHILLKSKCIHLFQYIHDVITYWNGILKKNLSNDFATIIKNVQWPIVGSNSLTSVPSSDAMGKFQTSVEYLLLVQLPLEAAKREAVSSSVGANFPTISTPMSLLLQPLRRRFMYHFSGNRKTNRLDKPEWYFSQILTWIHDHENFVSTWVQPVYNDLGLKRSASAELMSGLVAICVEKLQSDLEQASYDDTLFSHMVDEALGFHRELTDSYPYPSALPSTPAVLTQAPIFVKWINVERKYARDKMDEMLRSDTAWSDVSSDEHMTEAAHSFLGMLSAITDRFSSLPQPGHRLQFAELERELVDDLRVSLLQLARAERSDPLHGRLPSILNTVHHVHEALQQWDISPAMLLLNHYRLQLPGAVHTPPSQSTSALLPDSEGGIFEETLSLLNRLEDSLIENLSGAVMLEVKAKSRPYRTDNWLEMRECDLKDNNLTASACPMYQILAEQLHLMSECLAPRVFGKLWRQVATTLNLYLFEELLLENAFSRWGGKVLERDVMQCLVPLFQQYTQTSAVHQFEMLREACGVLALANIPLAMKKAAIVGSNYDLFNGLPIEFKHLSPDNIALVIKRRADSMSSTLV